MNEDFRDIRVKPVWEYLDSNRDDLCEYIMNRLEGLNLTMEAVSKYVSPVLETAERSFVKPGYTIVGGTEQECSAVDDLAHSMGLLPMMRSDAEIVFYISPAYYFMQEKDMKRLIRFIDKMPVGKQDSGNMGGNLDNLFILAGQAHMIAEEKSPVYSKVLSDGYERLLMALPFNFWEESRLFCGCTGNKHVEEVLAERFYVFSSTQPELSARFMEDLVSFVKTLPEKINLYAKREITNCVNQIFLELQSEITMIESKLVKLEEEMELSESSDKKICLDRKYLSESVEALKRLQIFYERMIR